MDLERFRRSILVKNGFLLYNVMQILIIVSIIYYVKPAPLTLDLDRLHVKVTQKNSLTKISYKKPIVILGEFYITISFLIEFMFKWAKEDDRKLNRSEKLSTQFWYCLDLFMVFSMVGCFSLLLYK